MGEDVEGSRKIGKQVMRTIEENRMAEKLKILLFCHIKKIKRYSQKPTLSFTSSF